MKKYLKFGFAAIAAFFIFSIFAAGEANAQGQGVLNEILKRMDEHQKALTSLRANVVMDKFNSQLSIHDINEGTAQYLPSKGRDASVRIDWTKPVQETLAVVNKQYVLYRPRLGQALTGNANSKGNSSGNALGFMSMSKEQLRANYTVKYMGTETVSGGSQTWHLELTPKTAQSYKSAEIWVDTDGMPVQAKIIENNGDSTTVLLSNLQKNVTIDAKQFKLALPKETKIIKA